MGGGIGLLLGVLLTLAVTQVYQLITDTIPSTARNVETFNELNELRLQINQRNEDRKRKELEQVEAVRQAVGAVTTTVRPPEKEPASTPASKEGEIAKKPPVVKQRGDFDDVDDAIKDLEQTQKVLNTILDLLTRDKGKARPKER
jgi:hypothetical protein